MILEYCGQVLLVDPMLDDAGTRPAIQNSPNPRNNPLVGLPMPANEVIQGVEALFVTHTHSDHWDGAAARNLPKDIPSFGQIEDEEKFRSQGFARVQSVTSSATWNVIEITHTGGQHGRGEIAEAMAPVSGFVMRTSGEPTLYIAGDTIWCDEVETALHEHKPAVVVVNTGAAQFLGGDPITMTDDDVITTCKAAPGAKVVTVHMSPSITACSPATIWHFNSKRRA